LRQKALPLHVRYASADHQPPRRRPQRKQDQPPALLNWLLTLPIVLLVPALVIPYLVFAFSPHAAVSGDLTPGSTIQISGGGFTAGSKVVFRWDREWVGWLHWVTADDGGNFTASASIPNSVAPGRHELRVREITSGSGSSGAAVKRQIDLVVEIKPAAEPAGGKIQSPTPQPTAATATPPSTPAATPLPPQPAATPAATPVPTPVATPVPTPAPTATPQPPGPPTGIVGYGAGSAGGAGGQTIYVTNLNDSGAGSLRAAAEGSGPRVVAFQVSGTITLNSQIKVDKPYVTIDGSTAPGPVVVRGEALLIVTHDVIVRHLRFRPGDFMTSQPADTDAVTINGVKQEVYNVVLDHLTMLWGPDIGGLALLGNAHDVTVQNSIMGEGLYLSRHPEGVASGNGHSMAANITAMNANVQWPRRVTFYQNLFTTSYNRMPRFQGAECVDVVNNVMYNWGVRSAHGNPRALNLVNNWFRSGPQTTGFGVWWPETGSPAPNLFAGSVYEAGSATDGFGYSRANGNVYASSPRCGGLSVGPSSPDAAYANVLNGAGATLPVRDAVDGRIIGNVTSRSGTFFNGAGYGGMIPYWP
jgi:pectate lyase